MSDPAKYTIGVNMYQANMRMNYSADWVTMFAGVMIVMVPSIIIYILFQRWIMEGGDDWRDERVELQHARELIQGSGSADGQVVCS
ncbi:hypothetical protein [Paenibacillus sp. GXUN7292]|uniref:hypothetical protein n=1 Tax=Paenibacillus sp. GXUN7292 TaxID=3422499 RepID=UPI003D7E60DA